MSGTTWQNDGSPEYREYRGKVAESFAEFYADGRDRWTGSTTSDRVTEFVIAAAPEARPLRVLDVGCGRGHQAVQLAQALPADVTGIDLLAVSEPGTPDRGSVEFLVGDFLELTAGPFDLLVDNGCLHHQQPEQWPAWVAHGDRLLADGGVWVISSFLSPTGEVTFHPQANGRQNVWFTSEAVTGLLAPAGLVLRDELVIDRQFRYQGHDLYYLVQSFGRA